MCAFERSEKGMDFNMKNQKGITLVALIITIIILLVLATVSINLIINSGIITKSKLAVDKYSEEEIAEQIKMSYLEYEMTRLSKTDLDPKDYLKESLEKIYGENSIKNIKEKNKKYTIEMQDESIYKYDTNTGVAYKYVDVIDYNGKTRATLVAGDDINIGTEKFKVFSKTDTEIKAMPYYNLVLTANPIKQATAETADLAGTSSFSSSVYWTQGTDEIDMSDLRNNIQQYINAYKIIFKEMGEEEIQVKNSTYSELYVNGVSNLMRNPSQSGSFWIASCASMYKEELGVVQENGNSRFSYGVTNYNNSFGVRPIIIIPIE